jgi:hypothetical protein
MCIATRPSSSVTALSFVFPVTGSVRALPHDLAHCVVEGCLGLGRGFWGSVADGAEFSGMERIEGPRKPHATGKAKTTSKENADYLSEAERLVACLETIAERNLDRVPRLVEAELREALATVHPRQSVMRRFMEADLDTADLLRSLEERLLKPETRRSVDQVSDLLADEFVEFGSSAFSTSPRSLSRYSRNGKSSLFRGLLPIFRRDGSHPI